MTNDLLALVDWLREAACGPVVMESTGSYTPPTMLLKRCANGSMPSRSCVLTFVVGKKTTFTPGRMDRSAKAQQPRAQEAPLSSASSQRRQKREVTIMFEPSRMELIVLPTASGWVAPPIRTPLGHRRVARLDETESLRAAEERSAR